QPLRRGGLAGAPGGQDAHQRVRGRAPRPHARPEGGSAPGQREARRRRLERPGLRAPASLQPAGAPCRRPARPAFPRRVRASHAQRPADSPREFRPCAPRLPPQPLRGLLRVRPALGGRPALPAVLPAPRLRPGDPGGAGAASRLARRRTQAVPRHAGVWRACLCQRARLALLAAQHAGGARSWAGHGLPALRAGQAPRPALSRSR
ncbi:hypothetical protein H632_c4885p0, partial [Helicosporidium sp. ATCC 50920]